MYSLLFLKSLLLGLAIAAPLGPIGTLCINRTLAQGFWVGLVGGLGTALADGIYATCAAVGYTVFTQTLHAIDTPLHIFGGLVMIVLGCKEFLSKPSKAVYTPSRSDLLGIFTLTFALTLSNPMTILAFAALFAGLGLAFATPPMQATCVVAGIVCGSLFWWIFLCSFVASIKQHLTQNFSQWILRLSGSVLLLFGMYALFSHFRQ